MLIQTAKKLKLILTSKSRGCLGMLGTSMSPDGRRSTLHRSRIFQGYEDEDLHSMDVADSETRESQKRSGKSTDTVAQLCTHEEEDDDSEDSEH